MPPLRKLGAVVFSQKDSRSVNRACFFRNFFLRRRPARKPARQLFFCSDEYLAIQKPTFTFLFFILTFLFFYDIILIEDGSAAEIPRIVTHGVVWPPSSFLFLVLRPFLVYVHCRNIIFMYSVIFIKNRAAPFGTALLFAFIRFSFCIRKRASRRCLTRALTFRRRSRADHELPHGKAGS